MDNSSTDTLSEWNLGMDDPVKRPGQRGIIPDANHMPVFINIRLPGHVARAVRAGAVLAPEDTTGLRGWEAFLAEDAPFPDSERR